MNDYFIKKRLIVLVKQRSSSMQPIDADSVLNAMQVLATMGEPTTIRANQNGNVIAYWQDNDKKMEIGPSWFTFRSEGE